jgi:hypothetical protein
MNTPDSPTIDLATTEQRIAELMQRPTVAGVIVAVRTE